MMRLPSSMLLLPLVLFLLLLHLGDTHTHADKEDDTDDPHYADHADVEEIEIGGFEDGLEEEEEEEVLDLVEETNITRNATEVKEGPIPGETLFESVPEEVMELK